MDCFSAVAWVWTKPSYKYIRIGIQKIDVIEA
jgi:hypothetical protein